MFKTALLAISPFAFLPSLRLPSCRPALLAKALGGCIRSSPNVTAEVMVYFCVSDHPSGVVDLAKTVVSQVRVNKTSLDVKIYAMEEKEKMKHVCEV